MPGRRTSLLAVVAVTVTVLTGCSGDDEPTSAGASTGTDAAVGSPTDEASADEPVEEPTDEPSPALTPPVLPTGLPTDIPTDLADIDVGDCADLYASVQEAAGAIEEAMADPTLSEDIFAEVSAALREGSADNSPEVVAAAEELATLYDEMGTIIGSGDPAAFAGIDIDRLTTASAALQEACLG